MLASGILEIQADIKAIRVGMRTGQPQQLCPNSELREGQLETDAARMPTLLGSHAVLSKNHGEDKANACDVEQTEDIHVIQTEEVHLDVQTEDIHVIQKVDGNASQDSGSAVGSISGWHRTESFMEVAFMTELGVKDDEFRHRKRRFSTISEQDYGSVSLYSSEGWAQRVARSQIYFNITTLVIVCNAIYIGIASNNDAVELYASNQFYIISENFFCAYFFIESSLRLLSFRKASLCWHDHSFVFDTTLTCVMVMETWVIAPITYMLSSGNVPLPTEGFRLIRLLRLARMGRLMTSFPELLTMMQGMMKGGRACVASVLMIMLMNYMFALTSHSLMKHEHGINNRLDELTNGLTLRSLGDCMWVFLVCGTFTLDGAGVILSELLLSGVFYHFLACVLLFTYLCLTNMVICNMLVGILCEIMSKSAETERDIETSRVLEKTMLMHLQQYDDGDGKISKQELEMILQSQDSKKLCAELDIDRVFLMAVQQMFFHNDCDHIPIRSVMELVLASRSKSMATVHTISAALTYLTLRLNQMQASLTRFRRS